MSAVVTTTTAKAKTRLEKVLTESPSRWTAPTIAAARTMRETEPGMKLISSSRWTEILDGLEKGFAPIFAPLLAARTETAREHVAGAIRCAEIDLVSLEIAGLLFEEMGANDELTCADRKAVDRVGKNLISARAGMRNIINLYLRPAMKALGGEERGGS